mgnify:CR=1 FL=1
MFWNQLFARVFLISEFDLCIYNFLECLYKSSLNLLPVPCRQYWYDQHIWLSFYVYSFSSCLIIDLSRLLYNDTFTTSAPTVTTIMCTTQYDVSSEHGTFQVTLEVGCWSFNKDGTRIWGKGVTVTFCYWLDGQCCAHNNCSNHRSRFLRKSIFCPMVGFKQELDSNPSET